MIAGGTKQKTPALAGVQMPPEGVQSSPLKTLNKLSRWMNKL